MTIIPKPSAVKKGDKLEVPLVLNAAPTAGRVPDVESQLNIQVHRHSHRMTTWCLLLTALCVVGMGIIGGTFLYDQYMRVHLRNKLNLNIPYRDVAPNNAPWSDYDMSDDYSADISDKDLDELIRSRLMEADRAMADMENQFPEEMQIDDDVEKIDVPDFKDGRVGRFIHDFNTNTTGIIDITGRRCFVMPLNHTAVLPPRSMFDMVHKMFEGYYNVDTQIVRHTMRVVTPPIDDVKSIGTYISEECAGKPIYKLEKYVSGVVKRSVDQPESAKFTEFAGEQVSQFNIVNYGELEAYEKGATH